MEYQFSRFQNTVCNFVDRWNTYNVLGKVENDNIYICIIFLSIFPTKQCDNKLCLCTVN